MPSNIRPKDFENYLPEETDTVAQGLVKFVQFAILFWRWFRSEFTSTGEWGYNIKSEMCASGCLDAKVIDPGNNNEEDDDDEQDQPELPGETPPELVNGDCCKKIEGYGKAGDSELDFEYFSLYDTGGTDLLCDSSNRKQVGVRNASGFGTGFQSNTNWENVVAIWLRRGGTYTKGYIDSGLSDTVDMANMGEVMIHSSTWLAVEVFIYGTSEEMAVPVGAKPESKIGGYFRTNPGADNEGAKIPFLIENGGVWGVRFIVNFWPMKFIKGDGFAGRGFKFFVNRKVPSEFWTTPNDVWWPQTTPYLCKISGIRMSLLGGAWSHGTTGEARPDWRSTGTRPCLPIV